ncbi:hypothetical protein RN001_013536 [Aquatica leii]|uniref:Uncharacterized protein n=1 Tax=Aquatica leii TaxID=1421715 RepID=A0AAN7P4K5_9COLE|nr:hypothetical protein RN001_013536 [Aquatica leii]
MIKTRVLYKLETINTEEKNLSSETVVVTNGSTGIGLTLAVKLAKLHANVGIWDKDEHALYNTQRFAKFNLNVNLIPFVCNMANKDDIYKAAEETKKELGRVSTVINTVTRASEKLFMNTSDDFLESVFQSNVLSQMWLTKAFLPNMTDVNSGRFIVISSMAGHMGIHKLTDYCASNAAVINFMMALRAELDNEGSSGIITTVVCPYFVKSSNLHKHTKLRLIRAVGKDDVADKTIQAMLNNESMVFLPNLFKYQACMRWLCPNFLSKFLKNLLIKDSNSSCVSKPLVEINPSDYISAIDDNNKTRSVCELSNIPPIETTQEICKNKEI